MISGLKGRDKEPKRRGRTPEEAHGNVRILFVDDIPRYREKFIRETIPALERRSVLSILGLSPRLAVEAAVASDGSEALNTFRAYLDGDDPFAVVISDYSMPGMTGVSLHKQIRKMDSSVPFIGISSVPECVSSFEKAFTGDPSSAALLKPADFSRLAPIVRNLLK